MNVILDANIIIAALMKDSTIRRIIITSQHLFFFPLPSLLSILKHHQLIINKSQVTYQEFFNILEKLFMFIQLIPQEELQEKKSLAKTIMDHIDPEDTPFIAAALCKKATIWSDDKHFQQQTILPVMTTKELIASLYTP
ncbi:MAG TPA: PIN domain-containing protein [Candidatus Nanoarchaeia archaeon]|nr:PIN domain-containing protein [Candidatus Nanoarchaeia archaeon]